jgi:putative transposase
MPTGFYLGFEPPCEAGVMQCIRHSILSKSYVKEVYPDIKATWPCSGVMSLVVLDRGTENFGNNLVDSCASLGIKVFYTPVKSPWFKGRVERFFRSLATSLIHQLP